MEDGLLVSALRGMDGTGMAQIIDPNDSPVVYKKALPSTDYLQYKQTNKLLVDVDVCYAMLGHTRSSTKNGYVMDENAHPFQFDHITLIHNGVVHNHKMLSSDCPVDVDSAHFAHALSKTNNEIDLLQKVSGEYCFIWHNAIEGTVNIVRNEGRPLIWAEIPKWGGIAFASEQSLLAAVLARHDIKIKDKFWYPAPHKLWKFQLGESLKPSVVPFVPTYGRGVGPPTKPHIRGFSENTQSTNTREDSDTHTTTTITDGRGNLKAPKNNQSGRPTTKNKIEEAKKRLKLLSMDYDASYGASIRMFVPYKNQTDYGMVVALMQGVAPCKWRGMKGEIHNVKHQTFRDWVKEKTYLLAKAVNVKYRDGETVIILEVPQNEESEKAPIPTPIRGPGGTFISEKKFQELTEDGCQACTGNVNILFADQMVWLGKEPICHSCAQDPAIMESLGIHTKH